MLENRDSFKEFNYFYINDLKARSSATFGIPVVLEDPQGYSGFFNKYEGVIETNFQYHEFLTSSDIKNNFLRFEQLQMPPQ